jgi:heme/copper-type cytochrome/quinol oxidase subunit 3
MTTLPRKVLDVSRLPETAYDSSSVLWWGNCIMFLIEGTTFVIVWASYAYLRLRVPDWPPGRDEMPRLLWGSLSTVMTLVLCAAVYVVDKIALTRRLVPLRRGLLVVVALGLILIALRAAELNALAFRWDSHAYGSLIWVALGMHLVHLIAGTVESAVMASALFIGPVFEKHLLDARVTGLYWYFIAAMWLPTWALVYLVPRYLAP